LFDRFTEIRVGQEVQLGSGQWTSMEFGHAKELIKLLQEMLDGKLIEVRQQGCGCLEKVRK